MRCLTIREISLLLFETIQGKEFCSFSAEIEYKARNTKQDICDEVPKKLT